MPLDADILAAAMACMDISNPTNPQLEEDMDARQLLLSKMTMIALPVEWREGITLRVLPCGHPHRYHIVYLTCRISEQEARDFDCQTCGEFVLQEDDLRYLDERKHHELPMKSKSMSEVEFWSTYTKHQFGVVSGVSMPAVQVVEALSDALSSLSNETIIETPEIAAVQAEVQSWLDNTPRGTILSLDQMLKSIFEEAGLKFDEGVAYEVQEFLRMWVMRAEALSRVRVEDDVDLVAGALGKMMMGG